MSHELRRPTEQNELIQQAGAAPELAHVEPIAPASITRPAAPESRPTAQDSNRTPVRMALLGGALAASLAGCSTTASSDEISRMPVALRYDHDYGGGFENGPAEMDGFDTRARGQDGCLTDSAYDVTTNRAYAPVASIEIDQKSGNIVVIPTTEVSGATKLEFLPIGDNPAVAHGEVPMIPADDATKGVLEGYGCETRFYEKRED